MNISTNNKKYNQLLSLVFVLFALCFSSSALAQNANDIRNNRETYIYGEGKALSFKKADDKALEALISQISVSVSSDFKNVVREYSDDMSEGEVEEISESVIRSYSSATLDNAEQLVLREEDGEENAHVMRYMLRSDIDKIFEARRKSIEGFVKLADRGLEERKIDNALKYYYWSYMLLRSLRRPTDMTIIDERGRTQELFTWLPDRIDRILDEVRFAKQEELEGGVVKVYVTYKDSPVASLDYTYYDGQRMSNIYSAKDGSGIIELRPGASTDNIRVRCEYAFDNEIREQREVETVCEAMDPIIIRAATMYVEDEISSKKVAEIEHESYNTNDNFEQADDSGKVSILEQIMLEKNDKFNYYNMPSAENLNLHKVENQTVYQQSIEAVVAAIKTRTYSSVSSYFTAEGYDMFTKLVAYGKARFMGEYDINCVGLGDQVICRSVPLSFSFSNNKRTFTESLSFTFNAENKIESVAFCLDKAAVESIASRNDWTEESRMLIVAFLENYKTAYALKRWDYLNTIFDDDALIITGHVARRSASIEQKSFVKDNQYVKLTLQTKAEYMRNLHSVFNSNEFINIKFATSQVSKFGGGVGEIYGIQIKQDYYSSNYADSGYLFLMVDLNDPRLPVIHVRTWQEVPDPEFGIMGNGCF